MIISINYLIPSLMKEHMFNLKLMIKHDSLFRDSVHILIRIDIRNVFDRPVFYFNNVMSDMGDPFYSFFNNNFFPYSTT